MPFRVITGSFHVAGYSPDGDSIRFKPDDLNNIFMLDGGLPRPNVRGHVQLRIEGIDALETHYSLQSGGGTVEQPRRLADAATDRLLEFLGIGNVVWNATRSAIVSAEDGVRGYVLSRAADKFGRPIAFVFSGEPPADDGSMFRLEADFMRDSFNHHALGEGLAYPTYYWGLFHDLRDELTAAVSAARNAVRGIYERDVTTAGFEVLSLTDLTDELVIMPKLFRRLSEYVNSTGTVIGFKEALEESQEPVLELPSSNFTHFDTFVEQPAGSQTLRLTVPPERLVFDPMPQRPANAFAVVVEEREMDAVAEMLA